MAEQPHVVGVCGSLRAESYTRSALRHALAASDDVGAETDLVDLRELSLPVFDADDRTPGDVPALKRRIRAADAVILATPMYHGSYSSPIKTALDYCGFDEFEGTTVGLLATSGGRFPVSALEHLRIVCRAVDAWVLPYQAAVPQAYQHMEVDDDGWHRFTDEDLAERVATLGHRVVQYASIHPDPHTLESEENVGAED